MRIIHRSQRIEDVTYSRTFHWRTSPGSGFGFPCDEQGTIDIAALAEPARANLTDCLDGTFDVVDDGVQRYVNRYTEPAVGECDRCRREVELGRFTNECECGADYNSAGQLLAPRSQWGEETGESLADILSIP